MTRATRNWGAIRSGETFEALATTLLFFEDSAAKLFGRRGRDGGQDARSGDGKTVYQAKHHVSPTAAKAISDAKAEVTKIAEYQKVGSARHDQWQGVTHWVLVTNATFNPTDEQTWKTEIVPQFNSLGLTAAYWEEATLDGYLDKHPEVDRTFFENENRVFLSPPEACHRVADDDPFTRRAELAPYVGRDSDLKAFDDFLKGNKVRLLVHAAGGTGKTRFLLEAANRVAATGEWQVLWANTHSLEASSTWFEAVVPERRTLLCIDDPDDERLIRRLQEQLGPRVGRAQQWKVAIAVRSSNELIVGALQHPKRKHLVEELPLKPLPTSECVDMCCKLFEKGTLADAPDGWRQRRANTLARRFDGYPIWICLAVHLLEEEGTLAKLPHTAGGLCRTYLDEAIRKGNDRDALTRVLQWVALLGPINREDDLQIEDLANRCGIGETGAVQRLLQRLVSARLLRRWGARDRLVDVKPDVLRDFIVRDWLCEERDFGEHRYVPSSAAGKLIAELSKALSDGTAGQREERVLAAVARTDLLLRSTDEAINLGQPLFDALDSTLTRMTPSQRIALLERVGGVGPYYPGQTTELLRRLRLEPAEDETVEHLWGTRTYSQDDVVLALSHAHSQVAHGLLSDEESEMLLEELFALTIEEARISPTLRYGLPNDGKRADSVIRKLLENGPSYCREFGEAAGNVVLRVLDNLAVNGAGPETLKALHSFVKPLCDVLRHQSWSDGPTMHMGMQVLHSCHPNVVAGESVLARIRSILQQPGEALDEATKTALWNMVSRAHQQANYAKGQLSEEHGEASRQLTERLRNDLEWAKQVISQRGLSPRELRAAREVWDWHAEFEKEEELGALAAALEELYFSHSTVKRIESLIDWDAREETERNVERTAANLANAEPGAIRRFVAEATDFLGQEDVRRVFFVASALGWLAVEHESVRTFLMQSFQAEPRESAAYQFAMSGISSWVLTVRRRNGDSAAQLVQEFLNQGLPDKSLDLLKLLYDGRYHGDAALVDCAAESALVRDHQRLFVDANAVPDFLACTMWGWRHDWPDLKTRLAAVLDGTSREVRQAATAQLVKQVQAVVHSSGGAELPPDLLQWLWTRLVATSDLGCLKDGRSWHLSKIVKRLGRVSTPGIVDAVETRLTLHETADRHGVDSPSQLLPLVEPVDIANADDPAVQGAIETLVTMLTRSAIARHWIPKLLARLDPQGLIAPRLLATRLEAESNLKDVRSLARAACFYGVGSAAWRQIARAAIEAARLATKAEREHVYWEIAETGRRSFVSAPGEVPSIYTDAVEAAEKGRADEQEATFRDFWEWRLRCAKGELSHEQERLKEVVWE